MKVGDKVVFVKELCKEQNTIPYTLLSEGYIILESQERWTFETEAFMSLNDVRKQKLKQLSLNSKGTESGL